MKKNFSLEPRRAILTRPSVSDLEKVGGDIKFMPTCVWLKVEDDQQYLEHNQVNSIGLLFNFVIEHCSYYFSGILAFIKVCFYII
jgi:hypothetical protein